MRTIVRKQLLTWCLFTIIHGGLSVPARADRPPLYSERLYLSKIESSTQYAAEQRSWIKQAQELGVPSVNVTKVIGGGYGDCVYPTALEVVREIGAPGSDRHYASLWAANQIRVFAACQWTPKEQQEKPVAPRGKALPPRALGDYLYQMGSWHFYRHELGDALSFYRRVAAMKSTPMRPRAAYMVIRTLTEMDDLDSAYETSETVLKDQTLRPVHAITANYRFVMMHPTHGIANGGRASISPQLAKRHLGLR